ncbi:MAG: acyl--CoA ligase [Oscillospiraceae bacterium]|nr:acyl--CoA ligase [Oscillospiraceae bacterium]
MARKKAPRASEYDQAVFEGSLTRIDRSADDFLFGMLHGEQREGYATNFMGIRTTFGQLDAEVEQVARALFSYGIRQGDYVSISLPNLKESILYMYACWRIGAIANVIDPRTNAQGILERVQLTDSKLLVTVLDICNPKIDEILDELPVRHVVVVSPADSLKVGLKPVPTLGVLLYSKRKKKFAQGHPDMGAGGKYLWHRDFLRDYTTDLEDIRAVYSPDLVAAVPYTSGTASEGDGKIKGAVITHRAFNAALCAFRYSVRPEEYRRGYTFGGFVPFFTSYGAICGMHASLCGGLEIILVPLFDPNKFAELLLKIKPNIFLSVPRFLEQLADHPKLQKKSRRLSFIKIAISGGDRISPASLERVNRAFLRGGCENGLRVGYGSTELGGSIAVMPRYDPAGSDTFWKAEGNVGRILPHCRAVIIDPDTGRELPLGQDGELCVHSLSQMERYLGPPAATEEITWIGPDGTKYFRMGDKGHLDESGTFYFIDRYKRSIMRLDGHTVHPSPIENVIMMHEGVEICAVVGLRREREEAGVIPCAMVVLRKEYKEKAEQTLREIDALCLKHLPERDRAIAYRAVDELPYTPLGKVHFRELEKQWFHPADFLITDLRGCGISA